MILCAALMVCLPVRALTAEGTAAPEISAGAAVLMDADTGQVLYGKDENARMQPASLTKLMTILLALENGDLTEEITVTAEALRLYMSSTTMHLAEGETLTLEQLLYGLMLPSANDAANAVGIYLDRSTRSFVQHMNAKAAELGLKNTHFSNAHGLPSRSHYASAYDLALITKAALAIPGFTEISGAGSYLIPATNKSATRNLTHLNKMLVSGSAHYDATAIAGKTGWTVPAGNCLMTVAQRNGRTLICIVLNDDAYYADTAALLDYGFGTFHEENISIPGFSGQTLNYTDREGKTGTALLSLPAVDTVLLLPEGSSAEDVSLHLPLSASISEDELPNLSATLQLQQLDLIKIPLTVEILPQEASDPLGAAIAGEYTGSVIWLSAISVTALLALMVPFLLKKCRKGHDGAAEPHKRDHLV